MSITQHPEKTLEKHFIKLVKATGNHWIKKMTVNGVPGYPDIKITRGNKYLLAEAKFFKLGCRIDLDTNISDKFKKTQPPFYLDFLKTSSNIFLFWGVIRGDGSKEYGCTRITKCLARKIPSIKYSDLLNTKECLITKSVQEIVDYILKGVDNG